MEGASLAPALHNADYKLIIYSIDEEGTLVLLQSLLPYVDHRLALPYLPLAPPVGD